MYTRLNTPPVVIKEQLKKILDTKVCVCLVDCYILHYKMSNPRTI